jgi:hypothetical protein
LQEVLGHGPALHPPLQECQKTVVVGDQRAKHAGGEIAWNATIGRRSGGRAGRPLGRRVGHGVHFIVAEGRRAGRMAARRAISRKGNRVGNPPDRSRRSGRNNRPATGRVRGRSP